tara:strand:+ start:2887 stop:4254 length:1368 start_codon:yes stop_codon:yes gene_type:complete
MFKIQNKIIIVDDNPKELETLSRSFLDNGIGCRPFQYINTYNSPLKNVRVAFFDINLGEKTVDDSGKTLEETLKLNTPVFNDLAIAINQYIAKDNGPYALFFWTKNQKIKDGFIQFMQNPERGFSDTASPIFIGCIDKTEFTTEEDEVSQVELSERLLTVLNDDEIKFLFDFENKANEAGEKTINKLYDIIPKDENWGENTVLFENLGKILSKIAASTLGFDHSKENPNKAVYEGLLPLLNSEIINSASEVNWTKILSPLFAAATFKQIVSPDDLIQKKVNSVFHIESFIGDKDVRGNVIEIDKTNPALLQTFNISDITLWFNKLIPFNRDKKANKRQTRNESRLVAIELSAACDFSNKKERINKYVLGFLTPSINVKEDINQEQRIESSYHLGGCDFHLEDSDFQIWLNLNFVFGVKSDDPRLGEPLFIMKKEIMDMLGNKYASHISRIGITSF